MKNKNVRGLFVEINQLTLSWAHFLIEIAVVFDCDFAVSACVYQIILKRQRAFWMVFDECRLPFLNRSFGSLQDQIRKLLLTQRHPAYILWFRCFAFSAAQSLLES